MKAADEHAAALQRYLDAAGAVAIAGWAEPLRVGGWSPAQITHHLILCYEVPLQEIAGGEAPQPRVGRIGRALLRWFLLPHMLFHRSWPVRAGAPREVWPAANSGTRDEALDQLTKVASAFAAKAMAPDPQHANWVTHPYFGRLSALRYLRLISVHLDHHRRQVEVTRHPRGPE